MTIWWYCPKCGKVTDEFESEELDELAQQSIIHICPQCKDKNDRH